MSRAANGPLSAMLTRAMIATTVDHRDEHRAGVEVDDPDGEEASGRGLLGVRPGGITIRIRHDRYCTERWSHHRGPVGTTPRRSRRSPGSAIRFSAFSVIRAVLVVVAVIVLLQLVALADTTLWWLAIATALAGLLRAGGDVAAPVPAGLAVDRHRGLRRRRHHRAPRLPRASTSSPASSTSLEQNAVQTAQEIEESEQFGQVATEFGLTAKVQDFFQDLPLEMTGGERGRCRAVGGVERRRALRHLDAEPADADLRRAHPAVGAGPDRRSRRRLPVADARSCPAYRDSSRYVWLMILARRGDRRRVLDRWLGARGADPDGARGVVRAHEPGAGVRHRGGRDPAGDQPVDLLAPAGRRRHLVGRAHPGLRRRRRAVAASTPRRSAWAPASPWSPPSWGCSSTGRVACS